MTLSARQLSEATSRRERLVEICGVLPEVTCEDLANGHMAFRIRKKTFAYYLFDHQPEVDQNSQRVAQKVA